MKQLTLCYEKIENYINIKIILTFTICLSVSHFLIASANFAPESNCALTGVPIADSESTQKIKKQMQN